MGKNSHGKRPPPFSGDGSDEPGRGEPTREERDQIAQRQREEEISHLRAQYGAMARLELSCLEIEGKTSLLKKKWREGVQNLAVLLDVAEKVEYEAKKYNGVGREFASALAAMKRDVRDGLIEKTALLDGKSPENQISCLAAPLLARLAPGVAPL